MLTPLEWSRVNFDLRPAPERPVEEAPVGAAPESPKAPTAKMAAVRERAVLKAKARSFAREAMRAAFAVTMETPGARFLQ